MDLVTTGWLALGFSLGLIHAFDADHVMALSVFATRQGSRADAIRAGLRWALGHGSVLLGAGVVLLVLGQAIPPAISTWAERAVGVVMVGLGLGVWLDLLRLRTHLHFHQHDDLPPHAHWHVHDRGARHLAEGSRDSQHGHRHGPLLVGALHGMAGSAPLLALLPASSASPAFGLAYLSLFALGVAVAMSLVSGLLGHFTAHVARGAEGDGRGRGLSVLRALSASGSIVLGGWLVQLG